MWRALVVLKELQQTWKISDNSHHKSVCVTVEWKSMTWAVSRGMSMMGRLCLLRLRMIDIG